jgi:23S rRNA U2552 (ribose-2'-O)-methylase RlmE/FtsJ
MSVPLFELPKTEKIPDKITAEFSEEIKYIFPQYRKQVNEIKQQIDKYDKLHDWDKTKKITNEYELIYISNNNLNNQSVSKSFPVSRSYFKMKEMMYLSVIRPILKKKILTTLSVAEAPGGFIEALHTIRKNNRKTQNKLYNDHYFGSTLHPRDNSVPSWNKIKKKHLDNVHLFYNDLYETYKIENLNTNTIDIGTADGGFDFSGDYSKQEIQSFRIIFSETLSLLKYLKKGGVIIIKLFDIFSIFKLKFIYLIASFFHNSYLYKPFTSRPANSERYLICRNYKGLNPKLINSLDEIYQQFSLPENKNKFIADLNIKLPNYWIRAISIYNQKFIEHQTIYLNKTFKLIDNPPTKEELEEIKTKQINYAKRWCKFHDEPT